jgi:predicted ferric reductase
MYNPVLYCHYASVVMFLFGLMHLYVLTPPSLQKQKSTLGKLAFLTTLSAIVYFLPALFALFVNIAPILYLAGIVYSISFALKMRRLAKQKLKD